MTRSATRELETSRVVQSVARLDALPDELLARVLAHLPSIRDLGRADGVCRAWHARGSPVEQALRLRIEARGDAAPAASAATTTRQLCWLELLRAARASSNLVCAGESFSAAVDAQGRLLVWGTVRSGIWVRLFHSSVPTPMATGIERISAGGNHILALTNTGEVLSFGDGRDGQLGHGDTVNRREPMVIEALRGTRVIAIAAGVGHSLALTDEGAVLSFGSGEDGRLGHGDWVDQPTPKVIEALHGTPVAAIAAGGAHSMVLTDEGTVLSFGSGGRGQLGHSYDEDPLVPKVIEALGGTRVVAIAAGGNHSMVLTDEGVVLSFGLGTYGQLGHGGEKDHYEPKVIEALRSVRVVTIAAGAEHSMVLTDEGAVHSFGHGGLGALGHGYREDQLVPKVIESLHGVRVAAIAAGEVHAMVLTDEGTVLSFGHEISDGKLGRPCCASTAPLQLAAASDWTPLPIPGLLAGPSSLRA